MKSGNQLKLHSSNIYYAMVTNHLLAPYSVYFTKKTYDSTAHGRRQEELYNIRSFF